VRRPRQPQAAPFSTGDLLAAADVALLVDPAGAVVESTATAAALGLVFGRGLADPRLEALVDQVRTSGRADQIEISDGDRAYVVDVVPVGSSRFVLGRITESDESHRIEAMRRDFVANVSHELKTPIGGLSLLAEAITDASADPDSVVRFAERMRMEVTRLSQMVTDLLSLSQLQGDDPLYDATVVRVDHVVDVALDRVRLRASHKAIALVARGDHGAEVFGNEEQLVVALTNLILNAIAYSGDKTQVGVGVRMDAANVEIKVTDQGIGIPEAEQERIFERFYRVDAARSRASGGTGLGLAIVKHIVTNHGGSISVWSREGEGSTFTIRLPKATSA
jgi:two-component system sensor histidine kinase SenX3